MNAGPKHHLAQQQQSQRTPQAAFAQRDASDGVAALSELHEIELERQLNGMTDIVSEQILDKMNKLSSQTLK